MKKLIHISKACVLTVLFLFAAGMATAQNNLNVTFRPGANFPVSDIGNVKLTNGTCGFEAAFAYKFMPHLQVYGGWSANWFAEKKSSESTDLMFVETGYTFGLQFIHPVSPESKLNFMLGAGGVYNHIETENKDGEIIHDTDFGTGWQAEAGLLIPVGHHDRWNLVPGVRYRSLSRENTSEGVTTKTDLDYLSVGLGVQWILVKGK